MVRHHPFAKKVTKRLYQGFFDLLPRESEFLAGKYDYKEGFFFGFHDISPFSVNETKILACQIPFDGRMPQRGESLSVGFFDFDNDIIGDFHKLADSGAWNFHKGCRLQWLDDDRVIFNTEKDGKLIAEIINITNLSKKIVGYPIDSIFVGNDKEIATSFCYERLNKCMPGYGYSITDGDSSGEYPKDTGLFLIDLNTGKRNLIVSLDLLAHKIGYRYLNGYIHFVTHTEFSKEGKYVSFLYRATPKGYEGKNMHKTWLVIHDLDTNRTFPLPTQESGSHYVWNNRNQILASCIINGKNCHVLFSLDDIDDYRIIAGEKLNSDGHQSFVNSDIFVTDTYPDKRRMAKLYIVNTKNSDVRMIGSIFSPKKFQTIDEYCHIACDLHPRVSPSGRYLCFDSPRTGNRAMYLMKLL